MNTSQGTPLSGCSDALTPLPLPSQGHFAPLERARILEVAAFLGCILFATVSVLQTYGSVHAWATPLAQALSLSGPGRFVFQKVSTEPPPDSRVEQESATSAFPSSALAPGQRFANQQSLGRSAVLFPLATVKPSPPAISTRLMSRTSRPHPSKQARIELIAYGPPTPPELLQHHPQGDGSGAADDASPSSKAPESHLSLKPGEGLANPSEALSTAPEQNSSTSGFSVARSIPPRVKTISPLAEMGNDPSALDLPQCFRLAAIRSDTLKISEQDILAAQARTAQSIANLYPTIKLTSSHNFMDTSNGSGALTSFVNTGNSGISSTGTTSSTNTNSNLSGTSSSVSTTNISSTSSTSTPSTSSTSTTSFSSGNAYNSSTALTLSLPIFNGLRNINEIGAARAATDSYRQTLRRSYQTLYSDVATSFYQILTSEGDLLILRDQAAALEGRVKELNDRVQLGRSRPAELLQSRADLANAKVTIEQARGTLDAARELLAFYIGIPANRYQLRESQQFPSAHTLESYLAYTGQRPDILSKLALERQSLRNLSAAKGDLWPTISVTADYTVNQDPGTAQDWSVGLNMSLPLFDGGLIISRIREQKELLTQSRLNVEQLMRTADQEMHSAFANFSSSAAQVIVLREYVELSGLNFDSQANDYRLGIVSNLDVLTALQQFHTARRQYHDADMTGRLNLIKLHVAAGTTPTSLNTVTASHSAASMRVIRAIPLNVPATIRTGKRVNKS